MKNSRFGDSAKRIDMICKSLDYFRKFFIIAPSEFYELHYGRLKQVMDSYSNLQEEWKDEL